MVPWGDKFSETLVTTYKITRRHNPPQPWKPQISYSFDLLLPLN
jgi:hypothetical protein